MIGILNKKLFFYTGMYPYNIYVEYVIHRRKDMFFKKKSKKSV